MNTNRCAIWTKAVAKCRLNAECEFKGALQSDCSQEISCIRRVYKERARTTLNFDIYSKRSALLLSANQHAPSQAR